MTGRKTVIEAASIWGISPLAVEFKDGILPLHVNLVTGETFRAKDVGVCATCLVEDDARTKAQCDAYDASAAFGGSLR